MRRAALVLIAFTISLLGGASLGVRVQQSALASVPEASGAISTSVPNGTFDFTPLGVLGPGPANHGFEDGLTGWTTAGSVTVTSGGIDGNYVAIAANSTLTSPAFTSSADADIFTIDAHTTSWIDWEFTVLSGTGFATETAVFGVVGEELDNDWNPEGLALGKWAGAEIKIRITTHSGQGSLHIDTSVS